MMIKYLIQVEDPFGYMNETVGAANPLLIQNKEKTFIGLIARELNEEVYFEIVDVLKSIGFKKSLAYFYCIVDKTERENNNVVVNFVKINPSRILPVETW